jgi:hypothetical protein
MAVVSHQCPAPGCTRKVRPGHLLCGSHWRRVPTELQRLVNRSWRELRSTSAADPHEYLLAVRAHRNATQAAVDALGEEWGGGEEAGP